MQIKNKKTISIIIAIGIVLVSIGTVGALNGWFGGGAKIPSDTMTRGLVGYWNFDEGTGTTTYDGSNYSNDGQFQTVASSPIWITQGKKNGALTFDGVNDYVGVGDDISLAITDVITMEAWIKIDKANIDQSGTIVWKKNGGQADYMFDVRVEGGIRFNFYNGSWQAGTMDTSKDVGDDVWHHVAVTYDRSNYTYYVDGVQGDSIGKDTAMLASGDILRIGKENTIYFFPGSIDDVRIYNHALTAEEIRYHYNHGGPVAHWTFDEGNGTTTYDMTDNDNDGTFMTTTTSPTWTTGKYGTALNFDGVDDGIVAGNDSSLDITDAITVETWVKYGIDDETYPVLLEKKYDGTYTLHAGKTGDTIGKPWWRVWTSGGAAAVLSTIDTNDLRWHHIVGTYNKDITNNNLKLYIDGVLNNQATAVGAIDTSTADLLSIGKSIGNGDYFNGIIDDVRIYNYARTVDEIALDYNAGFSARFGPRSSCEDDPGSCMDYGLVGYWKFDEGTGTTTYDGSNYFNDGQFQTVASSPSRAIGIEPLSGGVLGGGALQFDGENDYVEVAHKENQLLTTGGSVEAWIKPNSIGEGLGVGTWGRIIDKTDSDGALNGYRFNLATNGRIIFYINAGTGVYSATDAITVGDGNWYYVVATWNNTGLVTYYINGIQSGTPGVSADPAGITTVNAMRIGNRSGATDRTFNGLIDDVRVYNRALSAEEIRFHYNRGAPVAHWTFDEGNGTTTHDRSSNSNDSYFGTTTTSPTWTTGKYGTALSFDGTDDYLSISEDSSLDMTSNSFTVEAWVKTLDTNGTFVDRNAESNPTWLLDINNNKARFFGRDSNGIYNQVLSSSDVNDNSWHHLVGVIDRTNNKILLYFNGISVEENVTYTGNFDFSDGIYIGRRLASAQNYLNGLIDDVRIYNYARTPSQVQQDYNQGMAVHFGPVGEGIPEKDCNNDPSGCADYGLVGYWSFDEGTGNTAYDQSDSSNDGTLINDPSWDSGIVPFSGGKEGGGALSFVGLEAYDKVTIPIALSPPYTLMLWGKLNALPSGLVAQEFFTDGSVPNQAAFGYSGTDQLYFNNGTALYWGYPDSLIWHMYTVVVDGANSSITLDGGIPVTGTLADTSITTLILAENGNSSVHLNGLIDEVRIYNRALSVEEVRYHYNRGGPVAHWKFDEGYGTTTYDGTPNNNDGQFMTAASSPTWVQGKYGSALSFDGVDDYINFLSNPISGSNQSHAISTWIKRGVGVGQRYVVGLGGGSNYNESAIRIGNCSGGLGSQQEIMWEAWGSVTHLCSGVDLKEGIWVFVSVTFDGANVKIYVNGEYKGERTLVSALSLANTLMIGRRGSGADYYFDGLIDDVRIYNYARTQEQIMQDYNAGLSAYFQ